MRSCELKVPRDHRPAHHRRVKIKCRHLPPPLRCLDDLPHEHSVTRNRLSVLCTEREIPAGADGLDLCHAVRARADVRISSALCMMRLSLLTSVVLTTTVADPELSVVRPAH